MADAQLPEEKQELKEVKGDQGYLSHDSLHYLHDIEYHRAADFFDINMDDRRDSHLAEQISYLTDYVKNNHPELTDRIEILNTLKSITRGLGYKEVGPTLIKKLYKWARLDQSRRQIEKKMETLSIVD